MPNQKSGSRYMNVILQFLSGNFEKDPSKNDGHAFGATTLMRFKFSMGC